MEETTTTTYQWGIQSSSSSEAGLPAGNTSCGHAHVTVFGASDCLSVATRMAAPTGGHIANAVIHRVEDGHPQRLTDTDGWDLR